MVAIKGHSLNNSQYSHTKTNMCLPYIFGQSGALDLIPIETVPCLPRFYLKTNATMTYKVAVQEKYTLQSFTQVKCL